MLIPAKHQYEMLLRTQRTDSWLSKGRGWGGMGSGFETSRGRLLYAGEQAGSHWHLMMNHDGKEYGRAHILVYIHKHPFSTTQKTTQPMDITKRPTPNQIDYILCGQRWRGCKQAAKEDLGLTVAQITSFSAKFRLKLRKWGRPLGQPATT